MANTTINYEHDLCADCHSPGYLRDAFLDHIENDDFPIPSTLVQQLWNCTDVLPGWYCQEIDIPAGSSYADAAREISQTHSALVDARARRSSLAPPPGQNTSPESRNV